MASAAESTFIAAVNAAENTRQNAKGTALATYVAAGFTPAARTTYVAALVAADVAYITAVNSPMNTSGLLLDNNAHFGPVPYNIATIATSRRPFASAMLSARPLRRGSCSIHRGSKSPFGASRCTRRVLSTKRSLAQC